MTSTFGKVVAPVAAMLLLGLATAAQATTVSFYTVGYFTGAASAGSTTTDLSGNTFAASGPNYLQSSTVTVNGPATGTTQFSYFNNSSWYSLWGAPGPFVAEVVDGPENANFGYFSVASGDAANLQGLGFRLEVHQLAPLATPSTGSFLGSFSGKFQTNNSNVKLEFSPNVLYIPNPAQGVQYALEVDDGNITINRVGPSTLDGQVSVPLPGVALGGMALFGGLGGAAGWKRLRRRVLLAE